MATKLPIAERAVTRLQTDRIETTHEILAGGDLTRMLVLTVTHQHRTAATLLEAVASLEAQVLALQERLGVVDLEVEPVNVRLDFTQD